MQYNFEVWIGVLSFLIKPEFIIIMGNPECRQITGAHKDKTGPLNASNRVLSWPLIHITPLAAYKE